MTAIKETPRPITQHRPSFSSGLSIAPRNSLPRTHAYSSSLGSFNPAHRVTRRKSSNLTPSAINAAVAAIEEDKQGHRRSMQSRVALGSLNVGSYPSPPSSLPHGHSMPGRNDSAVIDGPPLASITEKSKNRMRRASDGSTLSSKKKPGQGELKCETCGKGYKHSSCLTKHLWEHTPEWAITSKLLISKHQQVQLLEAASVLVAMNQDGPEASKSSDSELSYASPTHSGSSDREDSVSSIETSPPPQGGDYPYGHHKRVSNASSAYSRSYQSVFTNDGVHQHRRQWSAASNRPGTAQTSVTESYPGEEQADLAAAVGLLSCSYGTPQTGPVAMPTDIPPVPPLPQKYQSFSTSIYQREIDMGEASSSEDESNASTKHRDSRQEDDDGVFGNMDE
ncbi:hypothetical protein KVT40_003728 [Elsinoe batatas]|uniref:C2H2-type domain-containing protein n=1 Tax=Elsinoe batatas TaxID=2601811 RepID=A0A8K0PDB0_9PEZI|nr:hypothetical protein KVT40_003728 [Elsinoe batatas]